MSQCKSVTSSGTRCKRKTLPGRQYCWQHESKLVKRITLGALVIAALTLIGLLADLKGLGFPVPSFKTSSPTPMLTSTSTSEFSILLERGTEASNKGWYLEALNYYQQALVIARETGDRAGEGTTLNNTGAVYHSQGRYEQALENLQQALVIAREIGDLRLEKVTLDNMKTLFGD